MAHPSVALGFSEDGGRCGNEFNSLHDLIMWLLRHKHPPHPDPDPWYREMTKIAEGLQLIVVAAGLEDVRMRAAVTKQGVDQTTKALTTMAQQVG